MVGRWRAMLEISLLIVVEVGQHSEDICRKYPTLLKFIYLFFCPLNYVFASVTVRGCAGECPVRGQGHLRCPKLELQVIGSCCTWMLGIKAGSSVRVVLDLQHCAMSSAPAFPFYKWQIRLEGWSRGLSEGDAVHAQGTCRGCPSQGFVGPETTKNETGAALFAQ